MCAEACHPAQLDANRLAVIGGFDRPDERGLALPPAPALAAGAFPADIGVIDLDAPGHLLGSIAFEHPLRQLVLDLPRRGLSDAETAAQFDAGDALLGLCHVIE